LQLLQPLQVATATSAGEVNNNSHDNNNKTAGEAQVGYWLLTRLPASPVQSYFQIDWDLSLDGHGQEVRIKIK